MGNCDAGYVGLLAIAATTAAMLGRACVQRRCKGGPISTRGFGWGHCRDSIQLVLGIWLDVCFLQKTIECIGWWCESCVCHAHLIGGQCHPVIDHNVPDKKAPSRAALLHRFEVLAGSPESLGTRQHCPLHGCRAPQLANGELDIVVEQMATTSHGLLWAACTNTKLTPEGLKCVLDDWDIGKVFILGVLRAKTHFWQTQPWAFAGIGHHVREDAIRMAKRCIELWEKCPAPSKQHRATNDVMTSNELRQQLESFAAGDRPLVELPRLLRLAVKFKFAPTVERTIEEGHTHVSRNLAGKRKQYPVTVSLSNRIPEIERNIRHNDDVLLHMARVCSRNPKELVQAFNMTSFPDVEVLLRTNAHPTKLSKYVVRVLYRTDTRLQYRNHEAHVKVNEQYKKKQKVLMGPAPNVESEEDLTLKLMHEHWREAVEHSLIGSAFSCKVPVDAQTHTVDVGGAALSAVLETPVGTSIEHATVSVNPCTVEGDRGLETDWTDMQEPHNEQPIVALEQDQPRESQTAYMRIVHPRAGHLKTVRVPAGSGGSLKQSDTMVSLHRGTAAEDQGFFNARPSAFNSVADQLVVMSSLKLPSAVLKETMAVWESHTSTLQMDGSANGEITTQALEQLVSHGALAGADEALEVPETVQGFTALVALEASGLVERTGTVPGAASFRISRAGMQIISMGLSVRRPTAVFQVRDVPVSSYSRWELMDTMQRNGWRWAPLQPRVRVKPCAIVADSEKKWFSDGDPQRVYMLALLNAAGLKKHGTTEIPHRAKSTAVYRNMLVSAGVIEDEEDKSGLADGITDAIEAEGMGNEFQLEDDLEAALENVLDDDAHEVEEEQEHSPNVLEKEPTEEAADAAAAASMSPAHPKPSPENHTWGLCSVHAQTSWSTRLCMACSMPVPQIVCEDGVHAHGRLS